MGTKNILTNLWYGAISNLNLLSVRDVMSNSKYRILCKKISTNYDLRTCSIAFCVTRPNTIGPLYDYVTHVMTSYMWWRHFVARLNWWPCNFFLLTELLSFIYAKKTKSTGGFQTTNLSHISCYRKCNVLDKISQNLRQALLCNRPLQWAGFLHNNLFYRRKADTRWRTSTLTS